MTIGTDELQVAGAPVRVITLNRPERGNGVTPEILRQLMDVLDECEADTDVRAVILTGTGKIFCAGADLRAIQDRYEAEGPDAVVEYQSQIWMPSVQEAFFRLWNLSLPVVAAMNGSATAGGLDLALCCDYRISVGSTRVGESYAKLGSVPVGGGSYLLPLIARRGLATRMLISGVLVSAPEAHDAGVIDEIVDNSELITRAHEVATELAGANRETAAKVKELLRAPHTAALRANLDASLEANRQLMRSPAVLARRRDLIDSVVRR